MKTAWRDGTRSMGCLLSREVPLGICARRRLGTGKELRNG